MPRTISSDDGVRPRSLVNGAIVVGALYFAREILLPFGLAILLSFLLAPLVDRLERWGRRRITAVLLTVTLAFFGIALLAFVLAHQAYNLAYELPQYKDNILKKMEPFTAGEDGVWTRASQAVEEMKSRMSSHEPDDQEISQESVVEESPQENLEQAAADRDKPIPVEVVPTLSAGEIARGIIGPTIAPLATAGLVTIFVIFMLLYREDLRNRLIQLVGVEQIHTTTQALDDAAARISRYLLMQFIINSAYGLVICIGLAIIGLPNAVLWGVMTALLRFIPYAGPWIAAIMPIAVSLAVFEGWLQPGLIILLFVLNELISNNVMEPWLYGSSTGISAIGILISAVFWAWIWGPVGLVMATPLTVCLTVMGRYVPQLAFLNTLLSDQEVLPPHSRYYQRLLAHDPEEAIEIAEELLATTSEIDLYQQVLIPALTLAEQDRRSKTLEDSKYQLVLQVTRELLEEYPIPPSTRPDANGDEPDSNSFSKVSLFCLPARTEGDEIVATMLAQLLKQRDIEMTVGSREMLIGEMAERISTDEIDVVCVSSLPPLAVTHARYICKRLRARFPRLKLVAGVWQADGITKKSQERIGESGVNRVALTLSEAAAALEQVASNVRLIDQVRSEESAEQRPPSASSAQGA